MPADAPLGMSSASLVRHAFSRRSLLALVALVGLVMPTLLSGGSTAAFTAATTNDNSSLSTVNFSLTNNQASALFTITDALPGDWGQQNVTIATVQHGQSHRDAGGATDTLYFKVRLQLPFAADNTVKSASVGEKKAAFTFTWTLTQSGTGADRTAG